MAAEILRDIIRCGAEAYGEQIAFQYKVGKEIINETYSEVNLDSVAVNRVVETFGMKEEHTAVIGTTSYQWITTCFRIVNSGSVTVPIDAQLPVEVVCELLNRVDVEMLMYDELCFDVAGVVCRKCPGIRHVVSIQTRETAGDVLSLSRLIAGHVGTYETELTGSQLCTILSTSDITGENKGVMLSHRGLTDNAVCLDMRTPAGIVSMTLLPIDHVYCPTMDTIKGFYIGMAICISDSIIHVQHNIRLFKPEIVLLVPLVIESVYGKLKGVGSLIPKKMVTKAAFGDSLWIIYGGGTYLDPGYVGRFRKYRITILQGYGVTECLPIISTNLEWENKESSVGKLLPNCEARVVDEEIWVRGSSAIQRYYEMLEQTARALEGGWFKTGNLGYVDEDNFIYITNRRKSLIILANSESVSPEELENKSSRSELVREILVREKDKIIKAEIFPNYEYTKKKHIKDIQGGLQELIDGFNKDIPVCKRTYSLIVREAEFEKTPSKKVKRFQSPAAHYKQIRGKQIYTLFSY